MGATTSTPPLMAPPGGPTLYRLDVDQYEAMTEAEILTERDRVELIDGYSINKVTKIRRIPSRLAPWPRPSPGWFPTAVS